MVTGGVKPEKGVWPPFHQVMAATNKVTSNPANETWVWRLRCTRLAERALGLFIDLAFYIYFCQPIV
jgi:hypothetical protein